MNAPSLLPRTPLHRRAPAAAAATVLLLGGDTVRLPAGEWPCSFILDPGEPFDALLILDAAGAMRAEALLRRQRAWLAPVADLSGSRLWFADAGGPGPGSGPGSGPGLGSGSGAGAGSNSGFGVLTTPDALDGILAILARLHTLPAAVLATDAPEETLLARIYSRGGGLQPVYDGSATQMLRLPAAGLLDEPAALAERLAEDGWLDRRFFDRLHVCSSCGSSRLNVREECPACRSADVFDETLLHHFRCAHQAPERQFRQGPALICPKCGRPLRHFGIDYDRPGSVSVCRTCGCTDAEAAVGFVCVDCGSRHPGDTLSTRDWYTYTLTGLAERRLVSGDLRTLRRGGAPAADVSRALARHWLQIQSRYGRPATVLRVAFTREGELQHSAGSALVMEVRRQAIEIIRNELRETDFLIETGDGVLIVMPETDEVAVDVPRRRLLAHFAEVLDLDLGAEIRVVAPAALLADGTLPDATPANRTRTE